MNEYSYQLKLNKKSLYVIQQDSKTLGVLPRAKLRMFLNFNDELDIDETNLLSFQEELIRYGRERLFKFLTYRERSLIEVRQFLKALPLASEYAKELVTFCLEKNFQNDKRFTEMFVMSAKDSRVSKREIRHKLKEKGISDQMIESAIGEFYPKLEERNNLKELADYAYRRYRCDDARKHRTKSMEYLIRKGYDYYDAKGEIDKLFTGSDDDFEF
ncbi:MAG: RecX family transcriptional regulator [Candidatus Zophobacter franzmannii]|nr:RecX family transcriptional regulator [Candidatus Zophobacter franzmannii]